MGLITRALGLSGAVAEVGTAATGLAEVFVPNATKKMEMGHQAFTSALNQYGQEFQGARVGWFDRFVNALNRLPRPALALGTLGLFAFAMVSPEQFSLRMQGLAYVPEPLWWLLGAVVSFYFGARELHYLRAPERVSPIPIKAPTPDKRKAENAALAEWQANIGR